ncbi:Pentraxin-related protein PTX3 [Varanus komodoensis]|uniref:Pentraxin-related protein PTX3 n=1 Tax=Varanus komodoensis TaxID=61221 RepID=A0A8D2J5N4_VARKO|nr:pentraxin-related protein PTX3 [Varanus komodoensis]KAF7242543.1 Pentraxin-related protein PTX3 [Varanus komodoensis]
MFSFVILFFALWSFSSAQNQDDYDDLFFLNFDNEVESVIPATEETISCDCQREHTEWDKLFIMLENSQMKENMLLQSLDEILKVELQTLRGEMLQFVEKFAGMCSTYIENTTSHFSSQMDQMLAKNNRETEQLLGKLHESAQGKILGEILQLSQNVSHRLGHLEHAWQRRADAEAQQRVLSQKDTISYPASGDDFILKSLWQELQDTKAELKESQKRTTQHGLPVGCETALLFPMRSKKIFVSVHPTAEMMLQSFTACSWVKVTEMLDKTIVFSYGTKHNPYEIQLYLSYESVVLVIGSDLNKIIATNVISSGQWTHICGTWSAVNGNTSLWINGKAVAASSAIAENHFIPDGGILQIGQEKNGCCVGGGFNESLAFSGKITDFNIWNRVLSDNEVTRQMRQDSCNSRGNVVGWGVTEVLPHGGAQYIFGP